MRLLSLQVSRLCAIGCQFEGADAVAIDLKPSGNTVDTVDSIHRGMAKTRIFALSDWYGRPDYVGDSADTNTHARLESLSEPTNSAEVSVTQTRFYEQAVRMNANRPQTVAWERKNRLFSTPYARISSRTTIGAMAIKWELQKWRFFKRWAFPKSSRSALGFGLHRLKYIIPDWESSPGNIWAVHMGFTQAGNKYTELFFEFVKDRNGTQPVLHEFRYALTAAEEKVHEPPKIVRDNKKETRIVTVPLDQWRSSRVFRLQVLKEAFTEK